MSALGALALGALALVGIVLVILGWPASPTPPAAPLPEADGPHLPGPLPSPGGASTLQSPRPRADLPASSLRIPALGVTARIGKATEENGTLVPPRTPTEVGLWSGSAALDAGSGQVTIVGHVNWRGMPPFAFGRLAHLHGGDLVFTSDPRGRQTAWRVLRVFARPKTDGVDPTAFAGPRGPRQLIMITCGGPFDVRVGSYSDNVYVSAVPA
ncbi:Sortase family enzyme [Frankia canadensis]|uniref:Sortase family enzyme n=1 Tax=Frankia canadensis TaxID=1836972 RepID=A0A2I2KYV5_9ACTN|nr:class F sortase [Frankia canadensis]SNQ50838.1 Sortase family enzyme [Frankia canadensis]SOU58128.1 Sortase family enzyme [Frankia canadensis]